MTLVLAFEGLRRAWLGRPADAGDGIKDCGEAPAEPGHPHPSEPKPVSAPAPVPSAPVERLEADIPAAVGAGRPARRAGTDRGKSGGDLTRRLRGIDPIQFRLLLATAFEKAGYRVERRDGTSGEWAPDLVLERHGERTAVQCRHWKDWSVNPRWARELRAAMATNGIRKGLLPIQRGFPEEESRAARAMGITVWNERDVVDLLRSAASDFDPDVRALLDDRRRFCPRCESEMVVRTALRGPDSGRPFWGCSRYPVCLCTVPLEEDAPPDEEHAREVRDGVLAAPRR